MTELGTDTAAEIDLPAVRKRTRWVLIGSVFPAGMGMTATFAATSLAAKEITDNDGLATLAATRGMFISWCAAPSSFTSSLV